MSRLARTPSRNSYDIVIVGGAIMGSAVAWFLSRNPDFDGRILVVERDASYAQASTTHTNSCIRQQFSDALNVRISQFTAAFIKDLRAQMGDDPRVPNLSIHAFGYLYLADTPERADILRANHQVQVAAGAGTRLFDADRIRAAYPFYALDDILLGSINTVDEGYWDGSTLFEWFRRKAMDAGVAYIENEVVAITRGARIEGVTLASGERVACGALVNASGQRAARTARMAGLDIPVEPRKRYTWVVRAEQKLERDLPLTIDPTGVHMRENGGGTYMIGAHDPVDPAVDPDDFAIDHDFWENHVWPIVATRIPRFEALRIQTEWVGHYAYNTLDQNAIIGPHPELENFLFVNGFSGHGLQQAPAMGRGVAEWLVHGTYRSLDLRPFHFERILAQTPLRETAII